MRSLVVVLGAEVVEQRLLRAEGRGWRIGSLEVAIRVDADAVEIFGVQVHEADYGQDTAGRQGAIENRRKRGRNERSR